MFVLVLFHPFHPTIKYLDAPSLYIPALYIGFRSSRLRAAPLSISSFSRSRPKSVLSSSYLCCVWRTRRDLSTLLRERCLCACMYEFLARPCLPSCAAARTEAFKGLPRPSRAGRPRHSRDARGRGPRVPFRVKNLLAAHGYPVSTRSNLQVVQTRDAHRTARRHAPPCLCRACCGGPVQRAT